MPMKKRRLEPSLAAQFLDVEADVDDDADETGDESDPGTDFIDEDDKLDRSTPEDDIPYYAHGTGSVDDEAKFLESIARDIQQRHRHNVVVQDDTSSHSLDVLLPTPQDLPLWRVHVKHGLESDVVFAIFRIPSLALQSPAPICSAFSRDRIKGAIYVEALDRAIVEDALKSINGVQFRSGQMLIDLVPFEERIPLLNMKDTTPSITIGSWVRIQARGKYKGDLGYVIEVDWQHLSARVTLVPRLCLENKRKRGVAERERAALFDVDRVKAVYGENVQPASLGWCLNGEVYFEGLLEAEWPISSLSGLNVIPEPEELALFAQSNNSLVLKGLHLNFISLRIHDRVQVISGEQSGVLGYVVDVREDDTITIETTMVAGSAASRVEAFKHDVCKLFKPGDFVTVVYGMYSGVQGHIVYVEDEFVFVYQRSLIWYLDHYIEEPGTEFRVLLLQVDFKHLDDLIEYKNIKPGAIHDGPSLGDIMQKQAGEKEQVAKRDALTRKVEPKPTRDPYVGMEVRIQKGSDKRHCGTIISTRFDESDQAVIDVRVDSRTGHIVQAYQVPDVVEIRTGLPLDRARWVPRSGYPPRPTPPSRSPTPPPAPSQASGPIDPAWDPLAHDPNVTAQVSYQEPETHAKTRAELRAEHLKVIGGWMLDPRLLSKRLDIWICRTRDADIYHGKHEEKRGYIILKELPRTSSASITVRLGMEESRLKFPAFCVEPEMTTERPGFVTKAQARPVVSCVGERVVIIGCDSTGNDDAVGEYALICACYYPLQADYALVQVCSEGRLYGSFYYMHASSLCRSHVSRW